MNTKTPAGVRSMSVRAVKIKADGSKEDLGRIAFWHLNPLRRLLARLFGV